MRKRAAIYARVSSDPQRENYSLPTQVAACRAYASQRNYRIVDIFQEAHTGTALERPLLAKVLRLAADGQIDVVVVHDLDRFTRIPEHLAILELEFEAAGALVEYVLGDFADSDEGQLSKRLKAIIARHELVQRTERTERGKYARAADGAILPTGRRAPYGYRYTPDRRSYVVDEGESAVVRSMYAWLLAGLTVYQIADRLTQTGVPRPGGEIAGWHPSTVKRMLRSSTYCGLWRFGGRSGRRRSDQHQAPPPVDVPVPALVDAATWQAAQARLDQARRSPSPRFYPLSGLVVCRCGRAWVGRSKPDGTAYYRCPTIQERSRGKACTMPGGIRSERLEAAVWGAAERLLLHPEMVRAAYDRQVSAVQARSSDLTQRLAASMAASVQVERRLAGLLERFLDGQVAAGAFTADKEALVGEQETLTAEIARLRSELAQRLPADPAPSWEEVLHSVASGLASLDDAMRRHVLQKMGVRVTVLRQNLARVSFFADLIVEEVAVYHEWKRLRQRKLRKPRRPNTDWRNTP